MYYAINMPIGIKRLSDKTATTFKAALLIVLACLEASFYLSIVIWSAKSRDTDVLQILVWSFVSVVGTLKLYLDLSMLPSHVELSREGTVRAKTRRVAALVSGAAVAAIASGLLVVPMRHLGRHFLVVNLALALLAVAVMAVCRRQIKGLDTELNQGLDQAHTSPILP